MVLRPAVLHAARNPRREGDGTLDTAVHYLELYMPNSLTAELGFGGARIRWKRQVTPAPSTPTFRDVPDTHPFRPFIEALAASGVTGGCGNGNYCPDATLKRGQMAVFLTKALVCTGRIEVDRHSVMTGRPSGRPLLSPSRRTSSWEGEPRAAGPRGFRGAPRPGQPRGAGARWRRRRGLRPICPRP